MTGMKNTLDLIVQYSTSNDLQLEATLEALDEFAGILEDDSKKSYHKLLMPAEPVAKSYAGFLADLHIAKDEGALKIYRDHSALIISGNRDNCLTLAANIRFLHEEALSQPQLHSMLHIHIEYFPGHFYLDPVSDPIVIYIRQRQQGKKSV